MSRGKWKPRRANGSVLEAFRHGRYNVRDQLGHYVKPESQADHLCHHRCCRGERAHPRGLPVKLDRQYLRSLSHDELERELGQYTRFIDTHEGGFLQVVAELDRREESEKRAAARKQRARERRQERESEYQDEVYRQWLQAEAETNGYMLNKAGKAAGPRLLRRAPAADPGLLVRLGLRTAGALRRPAGRGQRRRLTGAARLD